MKIYRDRFSKNQSRIRQRPLLFKVLLLIQAVRSQELHLQLCFIKDGSQSLQSFASVSVTNILSSTTSPKIKTSPQNTVYIHQLLQPYTKSGTFHVTHPKITSYSPQWLAWVLLRSLLLLSGFFLELTIWLLRGEGN